jgi:hypothetical protein
MITFTVQKPKPRKEAKTIALNSASEVQLSVKQLFGTDINSGILTIVKPGKKNLGQVSANNILVIHPTEKDKLKVNYQYLNKKYNIPIKIK